MGTNASNKLFLRNKLILKSGREVELSLEKEENNSVVFSSFFNTLDPVTKRAKPVSIRFEFGEENQLKQEEATVSFECRGGIPRVPDQTPYSEIPIEGLNGTDSPLEMNELLELCSSTKLLYQKYLEKNNKT